MVMNVEVSGAHSRGFISTSLLVLHLGSLDCSIEIANVLKVKSRLPPWV